jgi:hypothetical protein
MTKISKIAGFLILTNVALFGGVIDEPTTKLDKCVDFAKDVEKIKYVTEHSLFSEEKGAETKDKAGNIHTPFKSSSLNQIVRVYTNLSSEEKAYKEIRNNLTDNSTPMAPYNDIKGEKSFEQTFNLFTSSSKDENSGFNCYIKKGNETWIALYPFGKKDKEDKKDKKTVAIIQNSSDGTKMYFYQKPPKND